MAATAQVRPRTLVALVIVSAVVGAGIRALATDIPSAPPPASAVPASRASRHDGAGAVRAATRFVRTGQRVFELAPDRREAALRSMVAPGAAPGWLAEQHRALAELDAIAVRGSGPLLWDVAVLATRLDALAPDRATVKVWRLGILSIGGLTAPVAEYTTVAYELVWVRGAGWRIWSESQTPGPSPMPHPEATPSSPGELVAALEGFTRFPGPQAVVSSPD